MKLDEPNLRRRSAKLQRNLEFQFFALHNRFVLFVPFAAIPFFAIFVLFRGYSSSGICSRKRSKEPAATLRPKLTGNSGQEAELGRRR